MQSIDEGELARIGKRIDKLLKDAPSMRRKLHEQMGDVAYNAVMQEVSRSTQRHTGNLQRWQSKYVGSGGGYTAVRAEKGLVGKNSPGAITNYVNSGHRIRPSTTNRKRKINVAYVDGRYFYQTSKRDLPEKLARLGEAFVNEMAGRIVGKKI